MNKAAVVQAILRARLGRKPGESGEAFAPANIALVKYWGKRDEELNLPVTGSLSISLGALGTQTGVRPADVDAYVFNGAPLDPADPKAERLRRYLDLFRTPACPGFAVETANSIPTGAGLASSASGFAALALALDRLFDWRLRPARLSVLARLGSGSACRSVFAGFVEWRRGRHAHGLDSRAAPLPSRWPELCVGLLVLSTAEKPIGSRDAMRHTVATSPLYRDWPATVDRDLFEMHEAIAARDFELLGRTAEGNALAMHATMIAARPAVCYWLPETVAVIRRVRELRDGGLPVHLTMDAGPNVKLLFKEAAAARVADAFPSLRIVRPFAGEGECVWEGMRRNL